jgi:hypothetical protein
VIAVAFVLFALGLGMGFVGYIIGFKTLKYLSDPAYGGRALLQQLRAAAGGEEGIRRIGFACFAVALVFFIAGIYVLTDQQTGGVGLRFAIQLIGGGAIALSLFAVLAYQIPVGRDHMERNGFPWEEAKGFALGIGVVGAVIFSCSIFIH